ncbi:MAG: hypothetical protein ABI162_05340 [Luteolibacter sp.]
MTPKVSLNKLGEYHSQTNPARRRTIVKDQIKSNKAAAPTYQKAIPIIAACGIGPSFDSGKLSRLIEALSDQNGGTAWVKNDRTNTILALKHWQEIAGRIPILAGFTVSKGEHSPPKIKMGGTDISIRPDLIIRGIYRGNEVVGGIKLHFSKTFAHQLPKEGGKCVAALTQQFLQVTKSKGETARHALCFSVDIFAERIVSAPQNQANLLKSIEASCEEYGYRYQVMSENISG